MKVCIKCGQSKEDEDFRLTKCRKWEYRINTCLPCERYYRRERDKANPELKNKRDNRFYKNNKSKEDARYQMDRMKLKDRYLISQLKCAGLTRELILDNPILIELKRMQIKTKRELKNINNDNKD